MKHLYKQWIWRSIAILYLCTLLYIVFFAKRRRSRVWFQHNDYNVIPFYNKWFYLKSWNTLHPQIKYVFIENMAGNIFLFIPLSFLLFFLFHTQKFMQNILLCFIVSFGIELVQFVTGKGVADIDDVILNTIGGAIGFLIAMWFNNSKYNTRI